MAGPALLASVSSVQTGLRRHNRQASQHSARLVSVPVISAPGLTCRVPCSQISSRPGRRGSIAAGVLIFVLFCMGFILTGIYIVFTNVHRNDSRKAHWVVPSVDVDDEVRAVEGSPCVLEYKLPRRAVKCQATRCWHTALANKKCLAVFNFA